MRAIPKSAAKQLTFFQTRVGKWIENHAEIGLSAEEADDIEAKYQAARAAYFQQQAAFLAARTATMTFYQTARDLARAGSSAIQKIRATASITDDPNVYVLGSIDPPKKGSPIEAPGKPDQFSVRLFPVGPLQLSWKCKNPTNAEGTMYELWRTVEGGEKQFLAITGEKFYTDTTIPAGAKVVTYWVTAVRGRKRGVSASYTVRMGVRPGSIHHKMQFPRAA
jgi:hypothetical protein